MKYRSIAVLTVLLLLLYIIWKDRSSSAFFKPIKKVKPAYLGVMSYNIQYLPWKMKSLKSLREISRGYPILFFQECFNRLTMVDLCSLFPEYYISRGKLQGMALVNSGLATLSQYPILSQKLITFKNYRPYTTDALSEKGFLETIIDIDGSKLCCINTHLQSSDHTEFDPIVFDQLKEIRDYLSTVKIPYLLGGDFNIDVNRLVEHADYQDQHIIAPYTPTIYMNLNTGSTSSSPKPDHDGYVFDYFLVHPSITKKHIIVEVVEYSDHNPVFLLFDN